MSCVTTCTQCGTLYEESSEEQANSPDRICTTCWKKEQDQMKYGQKEPLHGKDAYRLSSADRPSSSEQRDWPDDLQHENGNYQCRCCECGQAFIGHKRRVTCKLCSSYCKWPYCGCTPKTCCDGMRELFF